MDHWFADGFLGVGLALAAGGLLLLGLNALIRRGLRAPRVEPDATPADLGLAYRQVSIPTCRGRKLGAWLLPADPGAPALILLHGWGGNSAMMLPLAAPLHQAGYTLLCVDARNHGMSEADNFSSMPRFAEDLAQALAWLRQQPGVVIPIIGARTPAQLKDNLGSVDLTLEEPQLKRLDDASRIEPGFPHDFFTSETVRGYTYGGMFDRIDNHRSR